MPNVTYYFSFFFFYLLFVTYYYDLIFYYDLYDLVADESTNLVMEINEYYFYYSFVNQTPILNFDYTDIDLNIDLDTSYDDDTFYILVLFFSYLTESLIVFYMYVIFFDIFFRKVVLLYNYEYYITLCYVLLMFTLVVCTITLLNSFPFSFFYILDIDTEIDNSFSFYIYELLILSFSDFILTLLWTFSSMFLNYLFLNDFFFFSILTFVSIFFYFFLFFRIRLFFFRCSILIDLVLLILGLCTFIFYTTELLFIYIIIIFFISILLWICSILNKCYYFLK